MSVTRSQFSRDAYDAVVVGSGPNGIMAAITLLQNGCSVALVEAQDTAGGGCRSAELTLPGFVHDLCSTVHPLGFGSPIFRTLGLEKYGLRWIHPDAPVAHPLDGGKALLVHRGIDETAEQFGVDAVRYRKLMRSLVPTDWDELCQVLLKPIDMLKYPIALTKFGIRAIQPAAMLCNASFQTEEARAVFAGIFAHSSLSFDHLGSASFGLVLGIAAHALGWPLPLGGAQSVIRALISHMVSLGGELITSAPVQSLDDLPQSRLILFDLTPRQILHITKDKLPPGYRNQLQRFEYGPGSFKIDWALDGPIPWANADCSKAATLHLGGTFDEIAESEAAIWNNQHSQRPYVLFVQAAHFDKTRAPEGKETAWAYCHVPNGSDADMTELIENQIERFAPGFRKIVLARTVTNAAQMEKKNANYIGGDITGGALFFRQLFTRPVARIIPYSTPVKGMYICSSSTPPGAGVHGMCGYYAAHCALRGWK